MVTAHVFGPFCTGENKTHKSVVIFEQLSRNKTAISCRTQSASKLQVTSPVTQSADELVL